MKRKLSRIMLIKALICVFVSSILTGIIVIYINNDYSFMNTYTKALFFAISFYILCSINLIICIYGLICTVKFLAIMYSSKLLNNKFVHISTREIFLKSFENFKKNFKVDFTDFYTAEARMDTFNSIHLKFTDKKGIVTDYKTVSAVDFLKYFKVI